jgi:peroxiredoxin
MKSFLLFAVSMIMAIMATAQSAGDSPNITDSVSGKEFELYKTETKLVDEKSAALNRMGSALYASGKLDEKTRDSLFRVRDQLDQEKRNIIADFARANPSSVVSAWAISKYYSFEPNLAELVPAYQGLSKENQQTIYGKQIAETIRAAEKTAIGNKAPDFTVADAFGKSISLHQYKGKFVLVDFWASWCGPCRAENPNVVRVYKKHHSDQFDILGVSLDNSRELWLKAIKKDGLEWKQGTDLKAWEGPIIKEYGLKGIPFNMLLDKDGKIIAKNLRGVELEIKLSEVLDTRNPG